MKIGVILLAAGSSSRMGQSKQLLSVGNESMLVKMVKVSLRAGASPLIVVLGAGEQEHRDVIEDFPVEIVSNQQWSSGMGSSLKCGLNHLAKKFDYVDAAIVLVCDQPHVSSQYIQSIIERYEISRRSIVASYYAGASGVPVLFDKSMFPEILNLQDDEGAKKLITQHPRLLELVDFPEGSIDLDTPTDYEQFMKRKPFGDT
ncbi:MAG TPA: nucleotidyltransferase family protein [Chryseolinea sp.]|nr:nucleotidyltransferase family protein [Chryseolinea sp.]HPH46669.1 nucleotidyltransferase family protein [Chryseolinea sp.]HPM31697.1 nucleotidyltransferase family protein [Chryseolinea sp.]